MYRIVWTDRLGWTGTEIHGAHDLTARAAFSLFYALRDRDGIERVAVFDQRTDAPAADTSWRAFPGMTQEVRNTFFQDAEAGCTD